MHVGYIILTNVLSLSIISAEVSVTTSYESAYSDGSMYYILNGESFTLVCEYGLRESELDNVVWYDVTDSTVVPLFTKFVAAGGEVRDTPWEDRVTWIYTDTSHRVTVLTADILTDGIRYKCEVTNKAFEGGEAYRNLTSKIYNPPVSVSLTEPSAVVEDIDAEFQCQVSSVFPGKSVTDFRLRVGSEYYTGGTETESLESNDVTYTVTYTYTSTFSRSQQGQQVQCEVTWQDGTAVETVKTSSTKQLDVYYPATVPTLQLSAASAEEGTSVTFTCITSSNPLSRLRLYRQREGESVSVLHSVTEVTLTHTLTVEAADNKADFYCRVDSLNRDITGWEFDVQSERQELTVWYQPTINFNANTSPNPTEGETREMTCSSTSANPGPVLTLYRGDVEVKSVTGAELMYTVNIRREISGVHFKCVATSSNPSDFVYSIEEGGRLYNVLFKSLTLDLTGYPSGLVAENTEVDIVCTTGEGKPVPTVRWYRDSESVSVDSSRESVTDTQTTEGTQYGGVVRVSTLKIQTHKSLNGRQYRCEVEGIDLEKSFTLQVSFPPEVSIQGYSSPVEEDSRLALTCGIVPGNPEQITSQTWEFQPKYPDSQSQALPGQAWNRELTIERMVYTDAGRYACIAGNSVGSDTGEIDVIVHYPPQLISTDGAFYAALGQSVTLNITVRAFPEIQNLNSAFKWTRDSEDVDNDGVTSNKLESEVFYSELVISSVTRSDYSNYTVTVGNGIKEAVEFSLTLLERGPPEAPRDVKVVAVAAEKISITWVVGLGGGSRLTFHVYFKKSGSGQNEFFPTEIVNPTIGTEATYVLKDLEPKTRYEIWVRSINENKGVNHADSQRFTVETREKPRVIASELVYELKDSTAKVSWKYEETEPDVTEVFVEQCKSETETGTDCIRHNVTDQLEGSIELPRSDGEVFYLAIQQDGLDAYRSDKFAVNEPPTDGDPRKSNLAVAIAVPLVVVIVMGSAIVLGIFFFRYRQKGKSMYEEPVQDSECTGHMPFYENVGHQPSLYEGLSLDVQQPKTNEYQALTVIQPAAGLTSNEIGIYEEIRKSRHIALHNENDLSVGNLFKEGRYSLMYEGVLCGGKTNTSVLIKCLRKDIRVSEAEYIFNQLSCLEQVGKHQSLVETFSFGIKENAGLLNFKLVTKYYARGDLRKFLQSLPNMTECRTTKDKHVIWKQLVLSSLNGFSFLEQQTPEILHYQLSSEHVLVDNNNSCRLTGFGFKEHILQREMKEEDEQIYGAIQWKAPEVIEDCKAHTKQSDVWAFGVLMHEIYSLGTIPYAGMTEEDVKTFVKSGQTLRKPELCPDVMSQMMTKCWTYNPNQRPTFTSLLRQLNIPKKPVKPVMDGRSKP